MITEASEGGSDCDGSAVSVPPLSEAMDGISEVSTPLLSAMTYAVVPPLRKNWFTACAISPKTPGLP